MNRFLTVMALWLTAAPALADDLCDDLWLSRNAVFDTAGFCFQSDLGQAMFDNGDCNTPSPDFDARQQTNIARISDAEARHGCDVDINRRSLDVSGVDLRKALSFQPVAAEDGQICQGYIGPALSLRTAPFRDGSEDLGVLAPGQVLSLRHAAEEGWTYVSVLQDGAPTAGGWIATGQVICEARSPLDWSGD